MTDEYIYETPEKTKRKNDMLPEQQDEVGWLLVFPLVLLVVFIVNVIWLRLARPYDDVIVYPIWSQKSSIINLLMPIIIMMVVIYLVVNVLLCFMWIERNCPFNRRIIQQWVLGLVGMIVLLLLSFGFLFMGLITDVGVEATGHVDGRLYILTSVLADIDSVESVLLFGCDDGGWWCTLLDDALPTPFAYADVQFEPGSSPGAVRITHRYDDLVYEYVPDDP